MMKERSQSAKGASFVTNFIAGLSSSGIVSFTTTILTASLLAAILLFGVDEDFFSRYGYRLFGSPDSHDWTRASQEALRLSNRAAPSGAEELTLVGASQLTEMLTSVEVLEEDLAALRGGPVEVACLAVPGLSIWELIGFVEELGAGHEGLVAVEVGAVLWRKDYEERYLEPKFAFRSGFLDGVARGAGHGPRNRSGIYLIDNRSFFLPRGNIFLRNLFSSPDEPEFHVVPHLESLNETTRKGVVETRRARMAEQAAGNLYSGYTFEEGVQQLDKCLSRIDVIRRLTRDMPRAKLVFLHPPENPEAENTLRMHVKDVTLLELNRIFWEKLSGYCDLHAIPLIDVSRVPTVDEADFYDHCHLGTRKGRDAATRELARKLAGQFHETPKPTE